MGRITNESHHLIGTRLLQVKDSTGEDTRKGVQVTSGHQEELPGSRGTANFALKWVRDSKHVAHLNVVEIPKELKTKGRERIAGSYSAEDDGKFVGMIGFDCRGLDVIDWEPQVLQQQKPCRESCRVAMRMQTCVHASQLELCCWMPCPYSTQSAIQDGFLVESTSGAKFEDVDVSEREWMDYDEKLGESIGIYDLEWKLQAVKL